MNLATRDRVRELFEQSVLMPRELRLRWIDSHADDPDVAAEVRALIDCDEQAGEFLAEPDDPHESDGHEPPPLEEPAGSRIGRYTLVRRIGEGGFGDVYLAEQTEPIRRRVALKLVKPGMDSRQVLARFDAERNALALLEHPNVARVIDAGATGAGRPYFVMELVEGAPITDFCDQNRLTLAQRIELFIAVCHAVQHAHQKGIIHRDLKPANVLVAELDGKPVPKVIDFGVAKVLLGEPSAHRSLITAQAQRLGTPAYMSPEQMSGHAVDTRSDVYGLGVMLYELLCGRLPREAWAGRDDEPPPMSRRVGESDAVAAARGLSAAESLRRALRGELEWIVAKCLRRDPGERYTGAAAVADDLEAFLLKRPVVAAPPSRLYLVRKFVRRNRLLVVVVSVAFVGVVTALLATARALVREREARKNVQDVNNYITNFFRSANPQFATWWRKDLTVGQAMDEMVKQLERDWDGLERTQPETLGMISNTIAQAYAASGAPEKGVELARRAVELKRKHLGEDHEQTLAAVHSLAFTYGELKRHAEALDLFRQLWQAERRRIGEDAFDTLTAAHGTGVALKELGRLNEAEPVLRDVFERKRRALGPDHPSTAVTANVLGHLLLTQGRAGEAAPIIRAGYEARRQHYGGDHPSTLGSQINVAYALMEVGELDEAERTARETLVRSLRVVGENHGLTRGAARTLAAVLDRQGKRDEAEAIRRRYPAVPAQPTTSPTSRPATSPA